MKMEIYCVFSHHFMFEKVSNNLKKKACKREINFYACFLAEKRFNVNQILLSKFSSHYLLTFFSPRHTSWTWNLLDDIKWPLRKKGDTNIKRIDTKLNISLVFSTHTPHSFLARLWRYDLLLHKTRGTNIRKTSSPRICSFLFVFFCSVRKIKGDLSMHEWKRKSNFCSLTFLSLIKSTYKRKWKWRFISCITSICCGEICL